MYTGVSFSLTDILPISFAIAVMHLRRLLRWLGDLGPESAVRLRGDSSALFPWRDTIVQRPVHWWG